MLMSDLELEEVEIFRPGERILGFFTYLDTYLQGKKEKFYAEALRASII